MKIVRRAVHGAGDVTYVVPFSAQYFLVLLQSPFDTLIFNLGRAPLRVHVSKADGRLL